MATALEFKAELVRGIEPVQGWRLYTYDEEDGDGFTTPAYLAVKNDCEVMLHTSRFTFTPTQERFAWLVMAGFPRSMARSSMGPISNDLLDAEIAAQQAAA